MKYAFLLYVQCMWVILSFIDLRSQNDKRHLQLLNIAILSHSFKLFNKTNFKRKCSSLSNQGRRKLLDIAWFSWPRTWVGAKVWSSGLELGWAFHLRPKRWRGVRWDQSSQIRAKGAGALVGFKLCCWLEKENPYILSINFCFLFLTLLQFIFLSLISPTCLPTPFVSSPFLNHFWNSKYTLWE